MSYVTKNLNALAREFTQTKDAATNLIAVIAYAAIWKKRSLILSTISIADLRNHVLIHITHSIMRKRLVSLQGHAGCPVSKYNFVLFIYGLTYISSMGNELKDS